MCVCVFFFTLDWQKIKLNFAEQLRKESWKCFWQSVVYFFYMMFCKKLDESASTEFVWKTPLLTYSTVSLLSVSLMPLVISLTKKRTFDNLSFSRLTVFKIDETVEWTEQTSSLRLGKTEAAEASHLIYGRVTISKPVLRVLSQCARRKWAEYFLIYFFFFFFLPRKITTKSIDKLNVAI